MIDRSPTADPQTRIAAIREVIRQMRSERSRYKSHDLGYVDSVSSSNVDDWADEIEDALDALASAQAAPPSPCVWVVGGYFGDLRVGHNMYFAHDRVSGWKFCPMCGHPLALPEVPHV